MWPWAAQYNLVSRVVEIHAVAEMGRVRLKPDDTRRRTGGEVRGKLANGVGSQYSHIPSECGLSSITTADAHSSADSS
jgi:hypothetical protein